MSEVVRVSLGDKWAYLPVGSKAHARLERFAKEGLANAGPFEFRLVEDTGAVLWETIRPDDNVPHVPLDLSRSLTERGIGISVGEELILGKLDEGNYNKYADLSWLNNPSIESGIHLSSKTLSDGDLVLTVWPSDGQMLPAMVHNSREGLVAELASRRPSSDRSFVMDELGQGLISATIQGKGESARILPPASICSWLFSLGTKVARHIPRRFALSRSDEDKIFFISDSKTGRRFSGNYLTKNYDQELELIEFFLAHDGLGGVLGHYRLSNA